MSLKAVLFDMDGVIVDTEPLHRKAYFSMFNDLEIEVSEDLYTSFTGYSTKKTCNTLIEKFNIDKTHEHLTDIKRTYFKDYFYNDADFDLIPGVRKLIEHYYENNVKLIVASSAMVIEDSTNGILAAHRANIFCAAYKSFHSHNQDYGLANIVVSDYSEIEIDKISKHF
ncbi:HAD family hydrolase [Chryseobacterium sp. 2TAF14]|uniref:HAD family hydrolase n=1 Tax=Chryseobacterium sp. 2TAF14 TaxID=3233007 RepID=UPI003F90F499